MSEVVRQGTPEWEAQRLGKLTASRFHEAVAKLKDGSWGASRENYKADLVVQRLRQEAPAQPWTTPAMQWGIDTEPQARAAYAFYRDIEVAEAGFIEHPCIPMSGCSPDGLVGDDGLVEFKCPMTKAHLAMLLGGAIPNAYLIQVRWQLACTRRAWCDYVSFDPRMPEWGQLKVCRLHAQFQNDLIAELENEARKFLAEVEEMMERLKVLQLAA